MKILLIQPPIEDFYATPIRTQPIGLAYLKAILIQHIPNINVKIFDFLNRATPKHTVSIPKDLKYLKDYYKYNDFSPFKTFYNYYRFGFTKTQIYSILHKEKDAIIAGISCNFTPYYQNSLEIAQILKEINPKIYTVLGGSHVSSAPESVLNDPNVDLVILKEGEYRFLKLIQLMIEHNFNLEQTLSKLHAIDGIGFKHNNKIIITINKEFINQLEQQSLDELPYPNFEFENISPTSYTYKNKPICMILTSRGCPYHCSFCGIHNTFGQKYKRRTNSNIIEEMKLRYEQGYKVFDFEDDNLTLNKKLCIELFNQISQVFKNKDIELYAMNGISYINLDIDILNAMKNAGFQQLNISLVSTNTYISQMYKRPLNTALFYTLVKKAVMLGLRVIVYYIVGLPQDNLQNMINTICYCAKLPVKLGISIFYPVLLTDTMQFISNISTKDYIRYRLTAMYYECENFKRSDLYTLFITSRIFNFLKTLNLKIHSKVLEDITKLNTTKLSLKTNIGIEVLKHFNQTKILYAYTKNGLKPLDNFNVNLFLKILQTLDKVTPDAI